MAPVSDAPNGYFEVELQPGESYTISARVLNLGEVEAPLVAYVANVVHPPNGGFGAAESDVEPVGVTNWVSVSVEEFVLEKGEETVITAEITVPEDATPGQHVTALVVSTSEALPIAGVEHLKQVLKSGIPVVVQVPGPIHGAFEIGSPTATRMSDEVVIDLPIVNLGNIRVQPAGTLTIRNANQEPVAEFEIAMDSVYSQNSAPIQITAPPQFASGEYTIDLTLTDSDTGASDSIENALIVIDDPAEPSVLTLEQYSIEPNAEDIVFATAGVTIVNNGEQLAATSVTLHIYLDGILTEEFSLATNQVMLQGQNSYSSVYVPLSGEWESGTYTFRITIHAVDPSGGQEIELLSEPLDVEIIVP